MSQRMFRADVEVPRVRTFTDEEGTEWEVSEVDGARVPAARGERCLVFQAAHAMRRVWSYPLAWDELSGAELAQLSWHR